MRRLLPLCLLASLTACTAILGSFEVAPEGASSGDGGPGSGDGGDPGEDAAGGGDGAVDDAGGDAAVPSELRDAVPLALAAGARHTCALFAPSEASTARLIACWGAANVGQLGRAGVSGDRKLALVDLGAVPPGALPVTAIRSHSMASHTCLAGTDRHVRCWGANGSGQTGVGAPGNPAIVSVPKDPIRIDGAPAPFANATDLALGGVHGCALMPGRIHCWGGSSKCQLTSDQKECGPDTAVGKTIVYGDLGSTAGVERLAAGGSTSCASQGVGFFCWGNNAGGAASTSLDPVIYAPVKTKSFDPPGLLAASGGEDFFVGVADDSTLWSWGSNSHGVVHPDKETTNAHIDPGPYVKLPGKVVDAHAGLHFACATVNVASALRVVCWGDNGQRQLGRPDASPGRPALVPGLRDVQALTVGGAHACAIARAESAPASDKAGIYCWGANDGGQALFNVPGPRVDAPTRLKVD